MADGRAGKIFLLRGFGMKVLWQRVVVVQLHDMFLTTFRMRYGIHRTPYVVIGAGRPPAEQFFCSPPHHIFHEQKVDTTPKHVCRAHDDPSKEGS